MAGFQTIGGEANNRDLMAGSWLGLRANDCDRMAGFLFAPVAKPEHEKRDAKRGARDGSTLDRDLEHPRASLQTVPREWLGSICHMS